MVFLWFQTLKHIAMRKMIIPIMILLAFQLSISSQNEKIVQSDGLFFTDATQTKLYSGEFKEYFTDKSIKVEINIKNGKPEGAYIAVSYTHLRAHETDSYLVC